MFIKDLVYLVYVVYLNIFYLIKNKLMKNKWNNSEAKKYISHYQKNKISKELALRIYTTYKKLKKHLNLLIKKYQIPRPEILYA